MVNFFLDKSVKSEILVIVKIPENLIEMSSPEVWPWKF